MSKIYGIFNGEYSDWRTIGFFTAREEAEKYCCVNTNCYIIEMPDLSGKEELSDISVYYEQEIVFELESGGLQPHLINGKASPWNDYTRFIKTKFMRNEPDRYDFYSAENLKNDFIEFNFNNGWLCFHINTVKADDRKRCEKIAQDYLAELYGDKGYITEEDINAMNQRFAEVKF